jgi:SOS-response transcriptional repressor LexA
VIVAQAELPLTDRQKQILGIIKAFVAEHGYGPTFRELMDLYGVVSPNGISCHIKSLRKKGYLRPRPTNKRMSRVILPQCDDLASIRRDADLAALLTVSRRVLGCIGPLNPKLRAELARCVERMEVDL